MKSESQLARLHVAGFEFEMYERLPTSVGAILNDAMVLLQVTPSGLVTIGSPGWRMGPTDGTQPRLGVLIESNGRRLFRYKQEELEASDERLERVAALREKLAEALASHD
jgi:hypothetical protein